MSDSLFSQLIPMIDSAIVDVTVTADGQRQSKLQQLVQARSMMLGVSRIMESIYHKSYECGADLCDLDKTACSHKLECEELVLKRQRIEGTIVMAADDPAPDMREFIARMGFRHRPFGIIRVIKSVDPVDKEDDQKTEPDKKLRFRDLCLLLRGSENWEEFESHLASVGVAKRIARNCVGKCDECELGEA